MPPCTSPGSTTPWDAARVEEVADRIASDTAAARERDGSWPRHPLDGPADEHDYSFWTGAAGILWALARLGHGVGEGGLLAGNRSQPGAGGSPGLMQGEVGVLLVSWKLEPTPEKEERLLELVAANADNPSHELFNGSPGTMLAALHVYEQTGDERWRELWLTCADTLLEQFRTDPEYGCRLWIQYRRGRLIRSIGAGHGFASNVHSLLRGAALLGEERARRAACGRPADRRDARTPRGAPRELAHGRRSVLGGGLPDPRPVVSRRPGPRHEPRGASGAATRRTSFWLQRASSSGRRGRSARVSGSVTARPGTAARSSPFTPARATSAGSTARERSRCTRSSRSSAPSHATRSGPATSEWRCISGRASTAGMECRCSTFSRRALRTRAPLRVCIGWAA